MSYKDESLLLDSHIFELCFFKCYLEKQDIDLTIVEESLIELECCDLNIEMLTLFFDF